MRRGKAALLVWVCACWMPCSGAMADLLWDNFITDPDGKGFDGRWSISSELNSTVRTGSWAADDAIFSPSYGSTVTVQRLVWAGANVARWQYRAELVVLKSDYSELFRYSDPNVFAPLAGFGTLNGYDTYHGEIKLPGNGLELNTDEQYFFGLRLTDSNGRNFFLSTGEGTLRGQSMAIFQSPYFGYPKWVTIDKVGGQGIVTDLAFRVYGVPEPGALSAMLCVLLLRRPR